MTILILGLVLFNLSSAYAQPVAPKKTLDEQFEIFDVYILNIRPTKPFRVFSSGLCQTEVFLPKKIPFLYSDTLNKMKEASDCWTDSKKVSSKKGQVLKSTPFSRETLKGGFTPPEATILFKDKDVLRYWNGIFYLSPGVKTLGAYGEQQEPKARNRYKAPSTIAHSNSSFITVCFSHTGETYYGNELSYKLGACNLNVTKSSSAHYGGFEILPSAKAQTASRYILKYFFKEISFETAKKGLEQNGLADFVTVLKKLDLSKEIKASCTKEIIALSTVKIEMLDSHFYIDTGLLLCPEKLERVRK